jgi:beta-xylosidase
MAGARAALAVAAVAAAVLVYVASAGSAAGGVYRNPVLPGSAADPSVVRVGGAYWATSTASAAAPLFPLYRSTDLVRWERQGNLLAAVPRWSTGEALWAPEIIPVGDRFNAYYSARSRSGRLCVAAATSATGVQGPYADAGTLVCQGAGSIDPTVVTTAPGVRDLVWKEDGNSRGEPTTIWGRRLTDDGLRLRGRAVVILRSRRSGWERGIIEGPSVIRRGGWLYLFYSGGYCCGPKCRYAMGVARSRSLLGPWQRSARNPILRGNRAWRCPGHGTVVQTAPGAFKLLYHAYERADRDRDREGLLDSVTWDRRGWPAVNRGRGPSTSAILEP